MAKRTGPFQSHEPRHPEDAFIYEVLRDRINSVPTYPLSSDNKPLILFIVVKTNQLTRPMASVFDSAVSYT